MGSGTKTTTAEFIARAQAAHGQKYDYSKVVFSKLREVITIICPEHGPFEQVALNHVNGSCCRKCAGQTRAETTAEFIARAQAAHGQKYDYSKVVYEGAHGKVKIICPEHGLFEQGAREHASRGCGCPKCALIESVGTGSAVFLGKDGFIARAQAAHGQKYDYSKVVYEGRRALVNIICPTHGPFTQTAASHLDGHGCAGCVGKGGRAKLTQDGFIARAQAAHGQKYDYSKVVYEGAHGKVKIICPEHGLFEQPPGAHLHGAGCRRCADKTLRHSWVAQVNGRKCYLYFISLTSNRETFYKIGITCKPINHRFTASNTGGYQYEILAQHSSTNAAAVFDWEQSIISTFRHLQYTPENRFPGWLECFSSCEEILEIFPL